MLSDIFTVVCILLIIGFLVTAVVVSFFDKTPRKKGNFLTDILAAFFAALH